MLVGFRAPGNTGKKHDCGCTEAYNRQFTPIPIHEFFLRTDPFVGCPQANPASIATAEFANFTDPGSRFEYNRGQHQRRSPVTCCPEFFRDPGYQ